MRAYIVRRLLLLIPTVLIVTWVAFLTVRLIPGNIVDMIVAGLPYYTEMDKAAIEHALGLDVPILVQYVRWMGNIFLHGDFGVSFRGGTPVLEEIMRRWPVTLELSLMAFIIGQLIALPIGIYSALRQDTAGDYIGRSFAILAMAVPGFWLGTMIIVFPAIWWGYMPSIKLIPFTEDPMGNLRMFIVPATVLGMAMAGSTMRMTRTMMLEVLRQDYIRTAWAKGLMERVVVIRHALKNALIPVITIMGYYVLMLVSGAVIIEQIFVLPGMGQLVVEACNYRDYPVLSGVLLLSAGFIMLANLMVDLTYGFLDPRIRYK